MLFCKDKIVSIDHPPNVAERCLRWFFFFCLSKYRLLLNISVSLSASLNENFDISAEIEITSEKFHSLTRSRRHSSLEPPKNVSYNEKIQAESQGRARATFWHLKKYEAFFEMTSFPNKVWLLWVFGFVLLCEDFETTHCHIYFNISSWEEMAKLNFEIILRSSDQPSGEVFCLKESKKSKKWVHINGMHLWQLGASALIQWVVMCTLKNYLVIMTLGFIIPLC